MVEYFCHVLYMFLLYIHKILVYTCKMLYFVIYLSEFHVCRLSRSLIKTEISYVQFLLCPHCILTAVHKK